MRDFFFVSSLLSDDGLEIETYSIQPLTQGGQRGISFLLTDLPETGNHRGIIMLLLLCTALPVAEGIAE